MKTRFDAAVRARFDRRRRYVESDKLSVLGLVLLLLCNVQRGDSGGKFVGGAMTGGVEDKRFGESAGGWASNT